MAKMPAAASGLPQVEPGAAPAVYQNLKVSPDLFGAESAKNLAETGKTIGKTALEAADTMFNFAAAYDEIAAKQRVTEVEPYLRGELYGNPDEMIPGPDGQMMPKGGYLDTLGADAMNGRGAVQKRIDEKIKAVSESLRNPNQQRLFNEMVGRYKRQAFDDIDRHARAQSKTWALSVNESEEKNALAGIATSVGNPERMVAYLKDLTDARVQNLQIRGLAGSPAAVNEAVKSAERDAIATQIEATALKNPLEAERIYEANKDHLGEKAVKVGAAIRAPVLRAKSQALEEQITAQGGGLETRLAKTNRIDDPELRDMVESRVITQWNRSESLRRERESDARATISLFLEDTRKSLELTGTDPGLIDNATINQAFAREPEKAATLKRQLSDARSFYEGKEAIKLTSPEEDATILAQVQSGGAGFAQRAQYSQSIAAAVDQKRRILAKDPQGYVFQNAPTIRDDYAAAAGDQEKMRQVLQRSLQLQSDMGVPAWQQRVLSDGQLEAVVGRFSVQKEGGENAAEVIAGLRQNYGDFWPQVAGELIASNKLPPAINALALMPPGRAASSLAEAVALGDKAMKDALNKDDVKSAQDAIPDELADLRMTLSSVVGGAATYQGIASATEALAYKYMGEGQSADAAVRRAADDVVNSRYQYSGTYRVPADQPVEVINAGAAQALLNLPKDIDLPLTLPNADQEATRASYIRSIQARGMWVTPPPPFDRGLVLYDETMSAVTVGGKPLFYSWEELSGMGIHSVPMPPESAVP